MNIVPYAEFYIWLDSFDGIVHSLYHIVYILTSPKIFGKETLTEKKDEKETYMTKISTDLNGSHNIPALDMLHFLTKSKIKTYYLRHFCRHQTLHCRGSRPQSPGTGRNSRQSGYRPRHI